MSSLSSLPTSLHLTCFGVSSPLSPFLLYCIRRTVTEKKDDPKGRIWTCNATVHLSPFSALSSPAPSVLCVLHKHTSHLPPWHHSMLQTHHTSSLCCVLQPSAEPSQLQDDHMHAFCVSCFPLCSFSDNTLSLLIHPSIHLKPNIQPPTHHRTFRKQKMGRTWSNMPVAALTKYLFFPTNILKFFKCFFYHVYFWSHVVEMEGKKLHLLKVTCLKKWLKIIKNYWSYNRLNLLYFLALKTLVFSKMTVRLITFSTFYMLGLMMS